jgi:hypothetical protein
MTKRGRYTTVATTLGLLLAGCEQPKPDIQLNPARKIAHKVDIAFSNLPKPAENVDVFSNYRVENGSCVKPQPLNGAVLNPEYKLSLPLTKVDENHYQAVFYEDAMHDADYFGLGLCRWQWQNVTVAFSSPSTRFIAGLSHLPEEVGESTKETEYFLHRDYFEKPRPTDWVFGEEEDHYLPKMGQQFSTTVRSTKLQPED